MMTVITGLTGSGKTYLMSRLLLKARKNGEMIYPNLSLNFPNDNEGVIRWHTLSETYSIKNGVIGIDEGQKLFDARAWADLPMSFAEKIASHRHHFLDVITTSQDFGHIDVRMRANIHELYNCQSLFRFPKNDRLKPILQIIKIVKKQRSYNDTEGIKWEKIGTKIHYLSKFWTKQLYDTYANIDLSHFICLIKREKSKWLITLTSRQLSSHR
jgi:hypothetical protein